MKRFTDRNCLSFWGDKEMRLEAAHLLDQADAVLKTESKQVTPFLSFAMRDWAETVLRKESLELRAEGGFPEAERVRIIIGTRGETFNFTDADISLLWVQSLGTNAQLEHRQILGSLIGLGLKRDVLGDIYTVQGGCFIAVAAEIASYVLEHWKQAGRDKIDVSIYNGTPDVFLDTGEKRRITVNSSRIDAILANAFGVSRTTAKEWIVQGKIRRNGLVVSKAEAEVQSGSIISCRGQGRIKLLESSFTRKERTAWQIILYRSQRH
jgi:RNA-binding protein YlmH